MQSLALHMIQHKGLQVLFCCFTCWLYKNIRHAEFIYANSNAYVK